MQSPRCMRSRFYNVHCIVHRTVIKSIFTPLNTHLNIPFIYSRVTIQMCAFQLLFSVESSIGRFDYRLLPDQALMEMLIDGFDNKTKKRYQDNYGMYLDFCEWSCVKCDNDESVIEIDIDSWYVRGSLELCYAPPKVKVLDISSRFDGHLTGSVDLTQLSDGMKKCSFRCNDLTGEIDLRQLPKGMKQLYLNRNKFTGEVDLTRLPDGMSCIELDNNYLTGVVDLTQLPDGMRLLFLNDNKLTGEVDLTQLPGEMFYLFLQNNNLTGEIDLTRLPDEMTQLLLRKNQLTGSLVIKRLPQGIHMIDVRGNHFNAIAVVDSEIHVIIELKGSGVTSVVDENGEELDMEQFLK